MVLAALSPVLEPEEVPEMETAPEPIVRADVLSAFPVMVVLPPLTVRFLVKVAPVTAAAVAPEARYWVEGVKAAEPRVPPPVGMVRVVPAAGQDKTPAPPLLVKLVVKVSPVTDPAVVAEVAVPAVVAVAALPPIERLATGVVEAMTNGAVPVVAVEVICPETVSPVNVPSEVMLVWAAPVTVAALPLVLWFKVGKEVSDAAEPFGAR